MAAHFTKAMVQYFLFNKLLSSKGHLTILLAIIVLPLLGQPKVNYVSDSITISKLLHKATRYENDSTSKGSFDSTLFYLKQASEKANDSIDINYLAVNADKIGVVYRKQGNYLSSLKFHNWALDAANLIKNPNLNSIILNNIGVVYRRLNDFQKALKFHLDALAFAEYTKNIKSQAIAINSIGNIQLMIGNVDESLESFKQSLILEQKLDNLLGIAINLNNIGNIYFQKGDYNKALEYYFLSLDVNKEIGADHGIAICYNDIGNVYEMQGLNTKALKYYRDALVINKSSSDKYRKAYSYIQVGELYLKLEDYDKALSYLDPGLTTALEIGAKGIIMDGYKAKYLISKKKHEYDKAFNYLELSHAYHDSIININVHKDIARLQIKFESEKKENQIALLEQEAIIASLDMKRQKTIILLSFSALIIALGFLVFMIYFILSKVKTNKLLIERNRIIEKNKSDLDLYSSQLLIAKQKAEENSRVKSEFLANMSHEIRTPLNSVIGFAEILSEKLTEKKHIDQVNIIKSSGRILLNLINDILDLSKIEAGKLDIKPEPVNIDHVLQETINIFEQRAHEKKIDLVLEKYNLPETVILNGLRLRQILFNLVGNAIKFTPSGYVKIIARSEASLKTEHVNLIIKVVDTGIGISQADISTIFEPFHQTENEQARSGTGLGLTITKRLVELLSGTINVNSIEGKGSEFIIKFKDAKISNETVQHEDQYNISLNPNTHVSMLVLSESPNQFLLSNIPGNEKINKTYAKNISEAKKLGNKANIMVIDGSYEQLTNDAIDMVTNNNLFENTIVVVFGNKNFNNLANKKRFTYISDNEPESLAISKFNNIFDIIATKTKEQYYFSDFKIIIDNRELVSQINSIYENEFKHASSTKLTSSIRSFINRLEMIAKRYSLSGLKAFCIDLENSLLNFDIDEIDQLLRIFDSGYENIKDKLNQ